MSLDPLTGQQPPALEKKCLLSKCPHPQKRAEVPGAWKTSPYPGWGLEAHVSLSLSLSAARTSSSKVTNLSTNEALIGESREQHPLSNPATCQGRQLNLLR